MIKKCKIFYLSGFDPRGVRFYKGLFNREIKKYSELSGKDISVENTASHHSHISSWKISGKEIPDIQYDFLKWDDIIRQHWIRNPFTLAIKTLLAYYLYITNVRWKIARKLQKNPIRTLFYPFITLIFFWVIFYTIFSLISSAIGLQYFLLDMAVSLIPTALVLDKIKSLWLLRFFIFNVKAFHLKQELLDDRLQYFADIIIKDLNSGNYDEVRFISHSNGTILSIPLLYKIFSQKADTSKLSVLSIGHCLPLATYYKHAYKIRSELEFLSKQDWTWHDIGAKPDGVSFTKQNPFLPLNLDNITAKAKLYSAAFYKYFAPEYYKKLRRNKFELHFLYLHNTDKESPFNFFHIVTSTKTIGDTLPNA